MKKVWIASIFATLMLLVPFSSVASFQEGELIESEQEFEQAVPITIEQLFEDLTVLINVILQHLGDYPEVVALCYEILEIISNGIIHDIICKALLDPLWKLLMFIWELLSLYGYDYLGMILFILFFAVGSTMELILNLLNCDNWEPPDGKSVSTLQTNLNTLSSYGTITLTELFQSLEISECPCGQ